MNHWTGMGNLTRDPAIKTVGSTQLCEFGIAINETWRDASGDKKEKVHFIDCKAWGKTGEAIAKYFSKGKRILVEGKISHETWDDKQSGAKRSKHTINVGRFYFLPDGKGRDANADARQAVSGEGDQTQPAWIDPDDGREVPF